MAITVPGLEFEEQGSHLEQVGAGGGQRTRPETAVFETGVTAAVNGPSPDK